MNACFEYFNVVSRNASTLMSHIYYFGVRALIALPIVIRYVCFRLLLLVT